MGWFSNPTKEIRYLLNKGIFFDPLDHWPRSYSFIDDHRHQILEGWVDGDVVRPEEFVAFMFSNGTTNSYSASMLHQLDLNGVSNLTFLDSFLGEYYNCRFSGKLCTAHPLKACGDEYQ